MAGKPGQAHSNTDRAAREVADQALRERMERIDRKILVLSGKGGVGKSTVAAGLALALAAAGKAVGLLDVDIHGPSIPKLMGLEGQRVIGDDERLLPVTAAAGIKVMSIGFLLPSENDAVVWRGPRKYMIIRQFLQQVEWGALDFLIIDAPPGTGDEPLAVAELVRPRVSAVLVTTPQDLAVADVRRSLSFCREVSLPVEGILENMSGLICPTCGHHIDLFKAGGGERLAEATGVRFLGRVPIDPQIVTRGDAGRLLAADDTPSPAMAVIANAIVAIMGGEGHLGPPTPAGRTTDTSVV